MKKILPEYVFTQEQLNTVSYLAKKTGFTESIVRILFARGVDTVEKITAFMNPSKENFLSPFLMSGMRETVDALTNARDEGKVVAVFGDYDADGICACTIMYYALKEFGIEARIYIPERQDGYGLNIDAVDKIFDECQPDIFLTVDCGISCAKEAQYIYELGADVIITDHHELPEVLPEGIIINPKLKDDYPYDNLCGAGVAFKLACALIGEKAYKLLDFATLATVADSVPLVGENRDIVTEGLKLFNSDKLRLCFSALLGKTYDEITAQTLSFGIAPRVNASGRMGDAKSAFDLFTSEKEDDILALATKLCSYNLERQKCCDELYLSAKEKIKQKGAYGKVIMLSDETWNSGFIGIVAAKIAEEYNRPTLLFVHNGEMLKGSARSIENVNIYSALRNCSDVIEEFGGHAQAAGINIKIENFDLLEKRLNEVIGETYTNQDFSDTLYVTEEITEPLGDRFAKELVRLEPFGVGHRKPLFSIKTKSRDVKPMKPQSPHLTIRSEFLDLVYFSGVKNLKILESDVEKQYVFEINVSKYRGREYVKGFVRDFVYDAQTGVSVADQIFLGELYRLRGTVRPKEIVYMTTEETLKFIEEKEKQCSYGLCLIASNRYVLKNYPTLKKYDPELFYPTARGVANMLIVSPEPELDLSGYRDFVFLDEPSGFDLACLEGKTVYVNNGICGYVSSLKTDVEREVLLSVYALLRQNVSSYTGKSIEEVAKKFGGTGYSTREIVFVLAVFEELGLISFEGEKLTLYRGTKTELTCSEIYRRVQNLQQEKGKIH